MQTVLTQWHGKVLKPSVETVLEAALRFFRTRTLDPFKSVTDYDEAMFLQARLWERIFIVKPNNSIGFESQATSQLHKEASQGMADLGETRVVLSDPGEPYHMDEDVQSDILLRQRATIIA